MGYYSAIGNEILPVIDKSLKSTILGVFVWMIQCQLCDCSTQLMLIS